MNLQVVIIDEVVHIDDPQVTRLWQKTLWAKEKGYRQSYKSGVIPMGADDFIATHLIVAEKKSNGDLEPVVMYKSIRKSQAEKFKVPFSGITLLNNTPFQGDPKVLSIVNEPAEISYDSSWTINPIYKKDKDLSLLLRDFVTMFCCFHQLDSGYSRWMTAGAKQFKIDNYFEWLGGQQLLPDFSLQNFDNQFVTLFYIPNTNNLPAEPLATAHKMKSYWDNRMVYKPSASTNIKAA